MTRAGALAWSIAAAACSDTSAIELAVDYPSTVATLEVSSTAFDPHTFALAPTSGEPTRLQGTVVILLPEEPPPSLVIDAIGSGDGNGVRLRSTATVTPVRSQVVRAELRLAGCGDGERIQPEACDDANAIGGDGCSAICSVENACGDGSVDPDEDCDDGGTGDRDGCSPTCEVEEGWECEGSPSSCEELPVQPIGCGDGSIDEQERCDDGNGANGDGCSDACAVEPGYDCLFQPSVCYQGATTSFVDGTRSDCTGDGTRARPFCTIQEGVDHVFQDVVVLPAEYIEAVTISGARRVLAIDGAMLSNDADPLTVSAAGSAVIYNLDISATGTADAVVVTGAETSAELFDLILSGANALVVSAGATVLAERCTLEADLDGAYVKDSGSSATIVGTVIDAGRGIFVELGATASATDCRITGSTRGVNTKDGTSMLAVDSSTISSSGLGARAESGSMLQIETSSISSLAAAVMTAMAGSTMIVRDTALFSATDFGVHADDGVMTVESSRIRGALGGVLVERTNARCTVVTSSIGPTAGLGLSAADGTLTVDRNYIVGNAAGGLYLHSNEPMTITNNIIAYNGTGASLGGGVRITTAPQMSLFSNNTIVKNRSIATAEPGVDCAAIAFSITNSIIWGNSNAGATTGVSATCVPSYTDLQLPLPVLGNISTDPDFIDPAGGDFHLAPDSPCVDMGDPNGVPFDLDGDARPLRNGMDMGADEVP